MITLKGFGLDLGPRLGALQTMRDVCGVQTSRKEFVNLDSINLIRWQRDDI